jgi:predicted nucleotidyltransferase
LPTTYCDPHDPEDQPEMNTAAAEQVIADTVQGAQAVLGSEIEAIFVLGSLAHGGFAPLVSDVDVAIVVGATALSTAEQMARVQSLVVALEWRNDGVADAEAASQLLGAELVGIHGECFAEYAKELEDFGEASRAAALAKRVASVQPAHL